MIHVQTGAVDTNRPRALFDNAFASSAGTITGDADTSFPVSNLATETTWEYWKPPSASLADAIVTLTSSVFADCAFIGAHELGSSGARFRIHYSQDGGTTWVPIITLTAPTNDEPIMVVFPRVSANAFRLQQIDGPAPIGIFMIGEALVFENGVDQRYTSFRHGQRIEVQGGNSLGGHFLGQRIRRRGGNTSIRFPLLTSDFVDTDMDEFETHYNDGRAFAFATNPDFRETDLAYCWRPDDANELRPQYFENGIYEEFTMNVEYYVGA